MPRGYIAISDHKKLVKFLEIELAELKSRLHIINDSLEERDKEVIALRSISTISQQARALEHKTCVISAQLEFIEQLQHLIINSLTSTYELRERNASRNLEPGTDANR